MSKLQETLPKPSHLIIKVRVTICASLRWSLLKKKKWQLHNLKIWKRFGVKLSLNEFITLLKKEQEEYVGEIIQDRWAADNYQTEMPTTTFFQNHISLAIQEVSGLMVYKSFSLGVKGGFLGGDSEVTGQRGRVFTPIYEVSFFLIYFISSFQSLKIPHFIHDAQRCQVTKSIWAPSFGDPPTAPPEPPPRWLDRNGFFKQCWLTAWSGYWTKASDACYQSGRKKKKSLFWRNESGTFLVRIEFSMKLKIIYSKISMDKHSILCERKVINVPLFSFIQESKSSVTTTSSGHDGLIRDSVPSPQKLGTCRDTE